jgi:hypothetical protein
LQNSEIVSHTKLGCYNGSDVCSKFHEVHWFRNFWALVFEFEQCSSCMWYTFVSALFFHSHSFLFQFASFPIFVCWVVQVIPFLFCLILIANYDDRVLFYELITLVNKILSHKRFIVFLTWLFKLNPNMQSKFFHRPQCLYNGIFYYWFFEILAIFFSDFFQHEQIF